MANANERRDGIPASSIHQYSLHGSSYHGKKIITPTSQLIESLDTTGSNAGVQSDSDFNDNPVTLDEERALGHLSPPRMVCHKERVTSIALIALKNRPICFMIPWGTVFQKELRLTLKHELLKHTRLKLWSQF